ELHPRFAELVRATAEPFVQVIVDVTVPRMAVGRTCLAGDAAFVARPHAAAATAKAAADALALADALGARPGDTDTALREGSISGSSGDASWWRWAWRSASARCYRRTRTRPLGCSPCTRRPCASARSRHRAQPTAGDRAPGPQGPGAMPMTGH